MSRRTEIQVGVTVVVALAILLWGVTWLKEISLQRSVRLWHVRFREAGGLGAGDEVQVNGIRKGSVRSMTLRGDHVVVDLALSSEIELTRDSRVAIRNVGLMGEKRVAVDLRTGGGAWSVRDTIPGVFEKGVQEVMAEMGSAVETVGAIADQVRALADILQRGGNFSGTVRNFHETSEELRLAVSENRAALRRAIEDFSASARTARSLTTEREAELGRALDRFSVAAENLSRLSGRLDSLRASIQVLATRVESGQGTLGRLVHDDALYAEMSASIRAFRALVEDIRANPKKYFKIGIF